MNLLFRILVAVYATVATVICAVIMISPFADKEIMRSMIEYMNINFYFSNRYDVVIFLFGLVFMLVNIMILSSGLRVRSSSHYYCIKNDSGIVRISANSIENIALAVAKKSGGVKEAKARAKFRRDKVEITVKMAVFPDVHVPNLSKALQEHIRESVETTTELVVGLVDISIDGVHTAKAEEVQ